MPPGAGRIDNYYIRVIGERQNVRWIRAEMV